MRVHLLETNASTRDALRATLEAAGHHVDAPVDFSVVARSSIEAQPDLTLIDADHPALTHPDYQSWRRNHAVEHGTLVVALVSTLADCDPATFAHAFDDVIALNSGAQFIALKFDLLGQRIAGQRARAENLRASEARLRELETAMAAVDQERRSLQAAIDSSPDLFWVKDRDLRLTRANAATAARFGLDSTASLIGKTDHDLFNAEDADVYRARELAVLESGIPLAEKREESVRDDHSTHAVLSTKLPLRSSNGEIVGLIGMLRDVTELVEAQTRIAANEARFRKLIQASSDVLIVTDRDARITWMAPAAERTLGRTAEERLGGSVFEHVAPEDLEGAHAVHAASLANPGRAESFLVRVTAADGSVRSILNTVTNLLGTEVDGIVLNGRDVTETLEAQDRLRREQEYVRVALDSAGMAAWQFDLVRDRMLWTPEAAAAFGLPKVAIELASTEIAAFVHPEDRHLYSAASLAAASEPASVDIEFRAVWPDGSVHWLEAKGQPSFDDAGAAVMFAGVLFDVTPRKESEARLHAEREVLEILMDQGPDAVFIKDRESRFTRVNHVISRHFGYGDPAELVGKWDFDLFPADEAQRYFADEQRVMKTGVSVVNRLDCHPRGAAGDFWILTSLAPIRDERLVVVGVIGTSRDVTHYSLDDRQLAIAEMRYRLVVEQIPAITCLYSIRDGEHAYEYISPQVEQMLGFTPQEYAELWLHEPAAMFHPDDRERMSGAVESVNSSHAATTLEYRHRVKGGGWKWVREIASPIPSADFNYRRWQGMIFDLTEDRALTERLEHQVFHDPLTGLPNRLMLSKSLDLVAGQSERSERGFALLFIDLDDFKQVNDSKGHQAGDAALIAVAERLRDLTRTGDTVARLGGDEFVVLLANISGPRNANEIAERIQRSFKQPFEVNGVAIAITPSIGVSLHDRVRNVPADMLREADAAMYEAKRAGRGRTRTFDPQIRLVESANHP